VPESCEWAPCASRRSLLPNRAYGLREMRPFKIHSHSGLKLCFGSVNLSQAELVSNGACHGRNSSGSLAMLRAIRRASSRVRRCIAIRRPFSSSQLTKASDCLLAVFSEQSKPGLAHAQGLDHRHLAIKDTIKDVSRSLSSYADVDLDSDAVYARTQSFGLLWLRQRSASLDPKCGNRRQLVGGRGNAGPILRRS
jgi:hypothetical protein